MNDARAPSKLIEAIKERPHGHLLTPEQLQGVLPVLKGKLPGAEFVTARVLNRVLVEFHITLHVQWDEL